MKTDDRDERLGSILDRAVRDIDVSSREAPVAQVRAVGRAGRVIAAVAAAAVFVGAVVFASAQFGRDTPPGADSSDTVVEGTLETDKWQLERPSDWFTSPFDGCGTSSPVASSVQRGVRLPEPRGRDPVVQRAHGLRRIPERRSCDRPRTAREILGVSLIPPRIHRSRSGPASWIDRSGSLRRGIGEADMSESSSDGEAIAFVRLWIGPDASADDVDAAYRILDSMRVDGGDRWIDEAVEFRGYPSRGERVGSGGVQPPRGLAGAGFEGAEGDRRPEPHRGDELAAHRRPRAAGMRPTRVRPQAQPPRFPRAGSQSPSPMPASRGATREARHRDGRPFDPDSATTDKIIECPRARNLPLASMGTRDRPPSDPGRCSLRGSAVEDDVARLTWATLDTLRFPEDSGTRRARERCRRPCMTTIGRSS